MLTANPKPELLPADVLLYFSRWSLFDWAVALKTWNEVAHCEVYRGSGMSVASRNGIGVNQYPVRFEGMAWILRPCGQVDIKSAVAWFETVQGQRYDWLGLLVFTLAVKRGSKDRMFCSEFATRFYRAGGFKPFSNETDADHVAPAQFLQSPAFEPVWRAKP